MITACATTPGSADPAAAAGDGSAAATPGVDDPAASTERLLARAPADFRQLRRMVRGLERKVEFIPAADDPADWREKLLFESFTLTPLPAPEPFLQELLGDQQRLCPQQQLTTTFSGTENGYDTAVLLLQCPHHALNDDGRITMAKAIRGNDAFYVIVRERALPAFGTTSSTPEGDAAPAAPISPVVMIDWSQWFRRVRLCDDGRPDAHPCPIDPDTDSDAN